MKRLKQSAQSTSRSSRKIHHTTLKDRLLLFLLILIIIQCFLPFFYGTRIIIDLGSFLPSSHDFVGKILRPFTSHSVSNATLDRLKSLEQEVGNKLNSRVVACRSPRGRSLCSSNATTLAWYNPSARDKFLCGKELLLGPGMTVMSSGQPADNVIDERCWRNPMEMSLTSHSFPMEATVSNKGSFPGIAIKHSQTQAIDNTFSSQLNSDSLPRNANNDLIYKVTSIKGEFGPEMCDIKCDYVGHGGLIGRVWVDGTDWSFMHSVEGEHYYSELHIGEDDWKHNKFYATTSFQSEVPSSYFSIRRNWWGSTLQSPPVPFATGIKGASFLARNCGSKNNRESVVKQLQESKFRVDSVSSCLKNAEVPPGVNLDNKTDVMKEYLFHLAFENGRQDDYITEKLWMAFHSGTIPVVLGPPNIKEHIGSIKGVIYVDDFASVQELADYLIEVSENQTLYESYHAWRKEPYPKEFVKRYNMTHVHPSCRKCRWAFAKKYGLGWDHEKQTIEPVTLSRETCVKSHAMRSPMLESWWEMHGSTRGAGKRKINLFPSGTYNSKSACPVTSDTIVTSRIGNNSFIRSLWSLDGTTDMYLEGQITNPLILKLEFPLANPSFNFYDSRTVWVQDKLSRISLVFGSEGPGMFTSATTLATTADSVEITIQPDHVPLRIRIIVEDQDTFHKGAEKELTYYGKIMSDDLLTIPELFVLDPNQELKPQP